MSVVRIGISGWTYAGWRGSFYPAGLARRRELAYAAARFGSIEINGTFYSLQRSSSFVAWRDGTPDDLVFAVKGGRFITHMKRLADVEAPLANFFASGVLALGPKLGPVLWQLPPTLAFEESLLDDFLRLLPRTTTEAATLAAGHDARVPPDRAVTTVDVDRPIRHALEARHESFRSERTLDLLRRRGVAIVVADTAGKWPLIEALTADFVYVRLHGDKELYVSGYSDEALDRWATKVMGWRDDGLDVFVYFDNDVKTRAPFDAMALIERCGTPRGSRMLLRPARRQDVESLTRIAHAAYERYVPRMGIEPPPMLADFGELVDTVPVLVAEVDESVVGYVVTRRETEHVLVDNLAVDPAAQGSGVGAALLSRAETDARESGVGLVRLYTNETMSENQEFYRRLGYLETHRSGEHPYRRVFFEKVLP